MEPKCLSMIKLSFWTGCATDIETKEAFFLNKLRIATSDLNKGALDDL
jgi:hypothetical protein